MKIKTSERLSSKMIDNIRSILDKEEISSFINSFNDEPVYGLRVNTLKISVEEFLKIAPFELTPVPWAGNGFYYKKTDRPAKHPYYFAGLYYLQEPSAMLPAQILSPDEKSRVLDLCAAPGGKSTQLAELMKNQGCLVVNDISPKRAIALIINLVRLGVRNAIVCNSKPETLAKVFEGYFSHILIDAPCSGEGMFRRDPSSIEHLSLYSAEECQIAQREILKESIAMLRNNGKLAYSTCTFNKIENEENLEWLSDQFDIDQISIKRIWPHRKKGEGQFVGLVSVCKEDCKIENKGSDIYSGKAFNNILFSNFLKETIKEDYLDLFDTKRIYEKNQKIYLRPEIEREFGKVNILKPGWFLGELKKNRFEPSIDLSLGLPLRAFKRVLNFNAAASEVISYLKGETIIHDYPEKGWSIIGVDGYPLGWFKKDGAILKNYYPKNMRRMD